jgi:hypothetical protein
MSRRVPPRNKIDNQKINQDDTDAGYTPLQIGADKRQEYNVSELEISIDHLRDTRDWSAVSALIKRYAHVFDIGCASKGGTNFTGERSRAYYWVVMAEVMIHQNKDMQNAGFCITRSAERDPDFGLWRIVLVKILLIRTRKLIHQDSSLMKSASGDYSEPEIAPATDKHSASRSLHSGGIQTDAYDNAIKELDEQERNLILSSLASFKMSHRKAILSAFSALPSDEILRIFMEILVRFNQLKLDHLNNDARIQWIYIICKKVLQNIHITDYYQQYLEKQLSEYNFWMVLDAISTRSLIREICGDMQQARSDIQQLVHVVVKQYPHSLSKLPESIRTSLLFTCCRLPILERNMNLPSASLDSFRFCVSGDSIIAPHLAESVKIALSMTAADMMIQLAYSMHQRGQPAGGVEIEMNVKDEKKGESSHKESSKKDSIDDIINHAYMLMVQAKDMLEVSTSETSASRGGKLVDSSTDFISHHPSSLIHDLKIRLGSDYIHVCRSDPVSLFEASPTGAIATEHVAILLASITTFLTGKKQNMQDPSDILAWAMSVNAKPSYDLLWNVSQTYLTPQINKLNESVCLMQQCIERKATTICAEENRTIFARSELSAWLGLGVQIHKYSALPALKCALTCLHGLGNPKKSIEVALQGLLRCTGGSECANLVQSYLQAPESLSRNSKQPHFKKSLLTLSLMSSLGSTALNIFQFILIVAKSFAALSRCSHAGHRQVQEWINKSCLMFDLLESTELRDLFDNLPVSDRDDWSFEDEFYEKCRYQALASYALEYSALQAEMRQITPAIKRLQVFLGEMGENVTNCDISNHFHLLAVLLKSKDDPDSQVAAINVCKKSIEIKSKSKSLYLVNTEITLAHLLWGDSRAEESIQLVDRASELVESTIAQPEHTKLYKSSMDFPFQQELLKIGILLECCALYRMSGNLDKAQHCIEEAWLILYSPTLAQSIFVVPKEKKETRFSTGMTSQPYTDEAKWISVGRGMPTLPGWRLPSGMGWGLSETFSRGFVGESHENNVEEFDITRTNYVSFEADLLAECANVLLCRMDKTVLDNYKAIRDIVELSLSVDPNHFWSKVLMAQLSVDVIEKTEPMARKLVDIVQANEYAQAALRRNSTSSEAW